MKSLPGKVTSRLLRRLRGTAAFELVKIAAASAWRPLLAQGAAGVVLGSIPVLVALLTRSLIDSLAFHHRATSPVNLVVIVAAIAVLGIASVVLGQVNSVAQLHLEQRVALHMQALLLSRVNDIPGLEQFERPEFLDTLQLAQQLGPQAPAQFLVSLMTGVQALVTVAGFLGSLVTIGWELALLVAASALPSLVMELRLGRLRRSTDAANATHGRRMVFYASLQTDQQVAQEVRLLGSRQFLQDRMRQAQAAYFRALARVAHAQARTSSLGAGLAAAITGAGLVFVAIGVSHGALPVGDIALYIVASGGLQGSLIAMLLSIPSMQQSTIAMGYFNRVRTVPAGIHVATAPKPIAPLRHSIEFEHVSFRYPTAEGWVLRDVSFSITALSTTALVGSNGSGKTTLVKLLCRFYDPTEGRVLWDGVDVREFDVAQLRAHLAVLLQDFGAYEFTARENIALGDLVALHDDSRIRSAAHVADLDSYLERLPRSYDTMLGRLHFPHEDSSGGPGSRLSGGEWQRLAIARTAFQERADVLVLDEMTSGLDPFAEATVWERIRTRGTRSTVLLISHRLGTVKGADEIVVLDHGHVRERGRHDTLMARDGLYAQLFRKQAAGFAT